MVCLCALTKGSEHEINSALEQLVQLFTYFLCLKKD